MAKFKKVFDEKGFQEFYVKNAAGNSLKTVFKIKLNRENLSNLEDGAILVAFEDEKISGMKLIRKFVKVSYDRYELPNNEFKQQTANLNKDDFEKIKQGGYWNNDKSVVMVDCNVNGCVGVASYISKNYVRPQSYLCENCFNKLPDEG